MVMEPQVSSSRLTQRRDTASGPDSLETINSVNCATIRRLGTSGSENSRSNDADAPARNVSWASLSGS